MKNSLTTQSRKIIAIISFYVIAISLRYYIAEVKPLFWQNANLYLKVLLLGIGPLIGGVIVVKGFKRPFELNLFSLGFIKSLIIILIPILLFSLVGIIETGSPSVEVSKYIGILILYALFEEYGWRGYLQSELIGVKKIYKYLIITTLWFIWHLNFELSLNNLIFLLLLFAGSYGIGYIADRSKSLIMCALFHSFSNIFQSEALGNISVSYKLIIITISAISAILIMRYHKKNQRSIKIS